MKTINILFLILLILGSLISVKTSSLRKNYRDRVLNTDEFLEEDTEKTFSESDVDAEDSKLPLWQK